MYESKWKLYFFAVLSLNVGRETSEEICSLRGFCTVSPLLANLYPDKILLFLRCHERQKCTEKFGAKIVEIKVAEINALLN